VYFFLKKTKSLHTKESYSHAFGAVLGHGETVLCGPYSYVMVIVESIHKLEYTIDGNVTVPCNHIDGYRGGFAIQVRSGRLIGMVFAWKKE
jgi:hypothetical protein